MTTLPNKDKEIESVIMAGFATIILMQEQLVDYLLKYKRFDTLKRYEVEFLNELALANQKYKDSRKEEIDGNMEQR